MKHTFTIIFTALIIGFNGNVIAQTNDQLQIETLLNHFLDSVNYASMHDRFWDDELIYTSSAGKRFGKKDIMSGFSEDKSNDEPSPSYSAEDVTISIYGEMAVLTFKLLSVNNEENLTQAYYNSGTLIDRNGQWKVICWQATKIPSE